MSYSGAASGYFSGFSNRGQTMIEQPAAQGINYVLLADHLTPGPIVFGLAIATKIEPPDGDRVPEVIAGTGPRRFVEISAAC